MLQKNSTTLGEVLVLFDKNMDDFPNLDSRLRLDADKVEIDDFEAAVVAI